MKINDTMKELLTIIFGLLSIACLGQEKQKVDLNWKIGKQENISYLTVISDIDTSSIEMNFGNFFKSMSDSTDKGIAEAKDLFKKLNQSFKNIDLVTTLTNKGKGVIDIIMTTRPKEEVKKIKNDSINSNETEILKMMQAMNQGVMLRGSVYTTGGIHSFWVKSDQKNLISLFFELPTKPVQVGDTWVLDINLITNDQNFDCDTSYKLNKVKLTDLRKVNGETIAVLKYDIVEYVKGIFNTPSFMGNKGNQTETMMKFTHQAIGEFSVDKGRWVTYDGIMTLEASGVMTANKKTKFTLIKE
jgi:ABC-type uncharacterized transport system permease subunit